MNGRLTHTWQFLPKVGRVGRLSEVYPLNAAKTDAILRLW